MPAHAHDPSAPRREPPVVAAILDATEDLLTRERFAELSVSDIIAAAGVSRTTFYAHFGSRAAALAACLRRVVGQLGATVEPFPSASHANPEAAIRENLTRWVALAAEHGPLLRTVSEQWPHDPELRELWLDVLARFSGSVAHAIERARAAGTAPPGADAQALATVLMWGCERVLHVSLVGGALGLQEPASIVEPLVQMFVGGTFGVPTR